MAKLSDTMNAALVDLSQETPVYAARMSTYYALERRGLVTLSSSNSPKLTNHGRAVLGLDYVAQEDVTEDVEAEQESFLLDGEEDADAAPALTAEELDDTSPYVVEDAGYDVTWGMGGPGATVHVDTREEAEDVADTVRAWGPVIGRPGTLPWQQQAAQAEDEPDMRDWFEREYIGLVWASDDVARREEVTSRMLEHVARAADAGYVLDVEELTSRARRVAAEEDAGPRLDADQTDGGPYVEAEEPRSFSEIVGDPRPAGRWSNPYAWPR